jgi:predicted homoserine dehydrogenase-like protein
VPDVGAKVAVEAIEARKHVIMLNVEADVCVGPLLYKRASEAGVVYSGSAGDEPGAAIELYDFADAMGFEVRVIGKGKNNPVDLDCTPESVAAEAAAKGLRAKMLCSFKDGTKTMVEMTAMCNATGFLPDVVGGHGAVGTVKDLPDLLSLTTEGRGGILSAYRRVEYIHGVAPGVFAIVATGVPEMNHEMAYLGIGQGPNYVLYRPYHLTSMETPLSVARACLDGLPTIVPRAGHVAETVAVAKRDLAVGESLDGMGGFTVRGTIMAAADAQAGRILPVSLVNDRTTMKRPVQRGSLITYDDVALEEDSLLVQLRREQDGVVRDGGV